MCFEATQQTAFQTFCRRILVGRSELERSGKLKLFNRLVFSTKVWNGLNCGCNSLCSITAPLPRCILHYICVKS